MLKNCLKCFLEFPKILTNYALYASHYTCIKIQYKQHCFKFLFECSIRVITMQRIGIFDSMHAFQCILNVLLEHIESLKNALLESIDLSLAQYVSIMLT